jgi:hypothetical protein
MVGRQIGHLSHQTHTVKSDCKDVNGNLVPDGEYTVYAEFTEAHEQGPLRGIAFEPVIAVTAAYTFVAEDLTVTYTVILTAESGSSSATHQESVTVSSPVGIGDSYATVPQVYPNPTSGIVMINLDGQTGSSTIKIFNLGGSLLYSEQKYNPGIHMVNISGYKSGTYLLQVDHDTHSSFQLIIKE